MRGHRALARWGCVAALFLAGPVAAGESVEAQRDRLRRVQGELEQKRREKEQAARRARELRSELDRVSRELDGARRALETTEERLREAEKKRAAAENRLWASRRSLGAWEEKLARALAEHYRDAVVGAEGTFLRRAYATVLLSDRVTGLAFAMENHAGVVVQRDQLLAIEEELRDLRLAKARDERRIETGRDRMKQLARTEEGRQVLLERQIQDLNASARRFERLIRDLIEKERAARAAVPKSPGAPRASLERWRGRVAWPVGGAVVEKFGRTRHPELDTFVISNGVRLRPAPDALVRAVEAGEVLFAGVFMNYGRMALVSHADGLHTIYANLGEVLVQAGQKVAGGEAIGRPGRDDQGRPVVYFEMRVDGTAVDPERFVQS